MPSGNDARFLAIKETTYNTRVTPTRSFEVTDDNLAYEFQPYTSVSLGGGPWRRRVITNNTEGGSGPIPMEALSSGMGFWFDLLHPNPVTPAQQAATIAYKQTHSLSGAPTKSITV